MSDVVRHALTELKAKAYHPEFVFSSSYGKVFDEGHIYWAFARGQKKGGLTNHYRFHDLRYAHLSPMHLAKAINIVSFGAQIKPTPEVLPVPAVPAAQVAIPAARSLRLVEQVWPESGSARLSMS